MIALVDCNSFYCACERVFQPHLRAKAIVVLSNNDGCVVARSAEAKAIPIAMGVPLFEIQHHVDASRVLALSSNYCLYGDLSARVMATLADFGRRQEVYSIDECFLDVGGDPDPVATMVAARAAVLRCVGIPTSVGLGVSKTLAKLGSDLAKKRPDGVFQMPAPGPELADVLAGVPVGDVWGIGPRIGTALVGAGVTTALDLARVPPSWMRRRHGVVGERVVLELRGDRCADLVEVLPPKQSITVSRSFGEQVTALADLRAAVGVFVERAAAKARAQHLAASALTVWVSANPFDPTAPACSGSATQALPVASNRTPEMLAMADRMVRNLWSPEGRWKKAGVMFLGLVDDRMVQRTVFEAADHDRDRVTRLMASVDAVNRRHGRDIVRCGVGCLSERWRPVVNRCSQRFTTRWEEVLRVD